MGKRYLPTSLLPSLFLQHPLQLVPTTELKHHHVHALVYLLCSTKRFSALLIYPSTPWPPNTAKNRPLAYFSTFFGQEDIFLPPRSPCLLACRTFAYVSSLPHFPFPFSFILFFSFLFFLFCFFFKGPQKLWRNPPSRNQGP